MDMGALFRLLVRRFYVAVPVFLLAAGLGLNAASSVQPDYEVTGAVLFTGPAIEEIQTSTGDLVLEPVNPLLTLGGSLGQVSEALALNLESQRVRAEFYDAGLEPRYEIGADARSPIMQFRVESNSSNRAAETLEALQERVDAELATRQGQFDLDEQDLIVIERLSADNEPSPQLTSRRRAQLLLGVSATLFTVLVTVMYDGAVAARRRRTSRLAHQRGDDNSSTATPRRHDEAGWTSRGRDDADSTRLTTRAGDEPAATTDRHTDESLGEPRPKDQSASGDPDDDDRPTASVGAVADRRRNRSPNF